LIIQGFIAFLDYSILAHLALGFKPEFLRESATIPRQLQGCGTMKVRVFHTLPQK